jgi:coniferyl-aldehyde dehydrogenase
MTESLLLPRKTSLVRAAYQRLRTAQQADPFPSLAQRRDWLERLACVLSEGAPRFVRAIDADFAGRSRHETLLVEVMASLETVRDARRSVAGWMRPRPVRPSPYFLPGRAWVEPLPLGVVGVIAPCN